jgi:hypothetical protein
MVRVTTSPAGVPNRQINSAIITLTVTVTDTYGRYVSGLSKGAFAVFDNKQQQEITFSATTIHRFQSE